ncbi:MAG: xanthine dehydrogenase family protein subunit M [Phycicoccus sp.]|nr:xanthine dehydrogenase family protein subunit M [Phycicoccus sp.]
MIPAAFDYVAPTSVDEALSALADGADDTKVLAGGQSLIPVLRMRLNAPEKVVDLGKIEELRGIRDDGDAVVVGAMTTYEELIASDLICTNAAVLCAAIEQIADPQIRRRGTIGGSLVHADPAGDVGAPILALGAQLVIRGADGERTVSARDFFVDLFETVVAEGELLTAIRIPKHLGWGGHYEKFVRTAQQWSIVAVAATVTVEGGVITDAAIGLTNMGNTPLRATAVEDALRGQPATAEVIAAAAAHAADGTNPPSDLNGDAAYRSHLAGVLTRRAITAAVA